MESHIYVKWCSANICKFYVAENNSSTCETYFWYSRHVTKFWLVVYDPCLKALVPKPGQRTWSILLIQDSNTEREGSQSFEPHDIHTRDKQAYCLFFCLNVRTDDTSACSSTGVVGKQFDWHEDLFQSCIVCMSLPTSREDIDVSDRLWQSFLLYLSTPPYSKELMLAHSIRYKPELNCSC